MNPVLAIIGRPNVGKSTLFNLIAGRNVAIIHDLPGVTRDRNYRDVCYAERNFTLVDTGGFDPGTEEELGARISEHAQVAVEEADVILFLMDAVDGLQHGDIEIARRIQKTDKPVIFVVNKVESKKTEDNLSDFYRLGGVDELLTISAIHRRGLSDLQDKIQLLISPVVQTEPSEPESVVSIIGRPNVGKSSLVNRLLGYDKQMVSEIAGTTRDPIDSRLRHNGKTIRIIDTAGIRKKNRKGFQIEKYTVMQALKSISRSEICILMIDVSAGVTVQDAKLAAQIYERNRACILVLNKWDLIEKDNKSHDRFVAMVREELAFVDFAPLVLVSALSGQRVRTILDHIERISKIYEKKIQTSVLNRTVEDIFRRKPAPKGRRGWTRIYYSVQVNSAPPVFKIFTNNPEAFRSNYRRYFEREMREKFGFEGVPLRLEFLERH